MYFAISSFLRLFIKNFKMLEVVGKEQLPADSKYVVTCTHRSWIDVIMLAIAVYPTPVHFMAKKELFESNLTGRFLTSINAFPVNRDNPGPSTLKIPLKILKAGNCVGIFPSGTRTSDDVPLKKGAATISVKANAPLVPAAYCGPVKFSSFLKGEKAIIRFGDAIQISQENPNRGELIEETLKVLEEEMTRLELLVVHK